jgi:hypothetical protein
VVIYGGVNRNVAALGLSMVFERTGIDVSDLPPCTSRAPCATRWNACAARGRPRRRAATASVRRVAMMSRETGPRS